jgi:hypothetical protein
MGDSLVVQLGSFFTQHWSHYLLCLYFTEIREVQMSKKAGQRQHFFNRFSKNFGFMKAHLGEFPTELDHIDIFLCPICRRLFSRDYLDIKRPLHLTIEHVPPDALMGKPITLTCSECNNSSGTLLDVTQLEDAKFKRLISSKSEGITVKARHEVTSIVGGSEVKSGGHGAMTFNDKDSTVFIDMGRNVVGEDLEHLRKVLQGKEVKIGFKAAIPNDRLTKIGYLRNAYLLAFARLGYGYILNQPLIDVARQVSSPADEILPTFGVVETDFLEEGVYELVQPKELRGLCVVFALEHKGRTTKKSVLLPAPNSNGAGFYTRFKTFENSKHKMSLNDLPKFDYLVDSTHALDPIYSTKFSWNS